MVRVAVLITLLNDVRVVHTLESLEAQSRRPDEVLVADGGSTDGSLEQAKAWARDHAYVRVEVLPGSVAATRNQALGHVRGDVLAFLDADETAPPGWLAALTRPLVAGSADFTGGPTRPPGPPATGAEAYLNRHDEWFYREVVPRDIAMLPMGNSAWSMRVFQKIGGFDDALRWGGEDYDVNLRALGAGFRGTFVADAWVVHDQSNVSSLGRLLRKKYRYMVGATIAYLKHGGLRRRALRSAVNPARFRHRYETLAWALKPFALLRGWREHRRLRGRVTAQKPVP